MSTEKFSWRKFRNTHETYTFDETRIGNFRYKLESTGAVPGTDDKIKVNDLGEIVLSGDLYADDLLAFARNWMKSIVPDDEGNTTAAIKAADMAILLMDNRAMLRHSYDEAVSRHEQKDQPCATEVCCGWEKIADVARNQIRHNKWGIAPRIYRKICNDGFNFSVDGQVYTAQGITTISISEGITYGGKKVPDGSPDYNRLFIELLKLKC
jgi:hypothetical protein